MVLNTVDTNVFYSTFTIFFFNSCHVFTFFKDFVYFWTVFTSMA